MLDLDNISPDYELVWPHHIFAAEATAIASLPGPIGEHGSLLLQEAFAGREPCNDFNSVYGAGLSLFSNPRDAAQRTHLRDLVKHAPRLADRSRPTPYWSSRNAPTSVEQRPQNRSFKNDWIILVSELFANGYFAKVAGYECPDGDSSANVNAALSRAITRRLHISNLWPPRHALADYSDDNVFYSLVEVLHDLAARPRLRTSHDFNGCRGHFLEGSLATGQAIYRWKVNQLLEESSSPYRLAVEGEDRGRLVQNFDDPRRELLEGAPVTTDPITTNDVEHAIALFRKRGATREDKRSACVALARVFEAREKLVTKSLLNGDADQLFRLANKFDLRHRDGKQYDAYGEEFQDWIFWNYLSTVELTNRLNQP